jgi:hypothetical protein
MSVESPDFGPQRNNLVAPDDVFNDAPSVLTAERDRLLHTVQGKLNTLLGVDSSASSYYSFHETYGNDTEDQITNRMVFLRRAPVKGIPRLYRIVFNERRPVPGGAHYTTQDYLMLAECCDLQYRESELVIPYDATQVQDFQGRGTVLIRKELNLYVHSSMVGVSLRVSMMPVERSDEELFDMCAAAYKLQQIVMPLGDVSHEPDVRLA